MHPVRTIAATTATALALATVSVTPSAQAAPGDLAASMPTPVSLPAECTDVPIDYSFEVPPDVTDWGIVFRLEAPNGTYAVGTAAPNLGSAPAGRITVRPCSGAVGTYHLFAQSSYSSPSGSASQPRREVATLESVAPTYTALSLKAKRKGKGKRSRVVAKATLTASTDTVTYVPAPGAAVTLQRLVKKSWRNVKTVATDGAGVAKVTLRTRKKVKVRAVYAGSGTKIGNGPQPVAAAQSRTVKVRRARR